MRLHTLTDYHEALRMNLMRLGTRYIEIKQSDEANYNQAKHSNIPDLDDERLDQGYEEIVANEYGVLRCRGLPFRCTLQEILNFFQVIIFLFYYFGNHFGFL